MPISVGAPCIIYTGRLLRSAALKIREIAKKAIAAPIQMTSFACRMAPPDTPSEYSKQGQYDQQIENQIMRGRSPCGRWGKRFITY